MELGVRGSENGGRKEEKMDVVSAGRRSMKFRGRKRDFWGLRALTLHVIGSWLWCSILSQLPSFFCG